MAISRGNSLNDLAHSAGPAVEDNTNLILGKDLAISRRNTLTDFAHSATTAIESNTGATLCQDHAIQSHAHKAMDKITLPLLDLPVELWTEIFKHISNYSDLKVLRLVSKRVSDVVTPRQYYEVDLMKEVKQEDVLMVVRIKALLAGPANLRFIRILKTPSIGPQSTQLMDQVLPLLRKNFMTEFSFNTTSSTRFPTPTQMQYLWARQENLQNLKLYSHMVPNLEEVLELEPGRSALLRSFTELDISDKFDVLPLNYRDIMIWPLRNLDLRVLQILQLHGRVISTPILSLLDELFAGGFFVNIIQLIFAWVKMVDTLTLTNMPSLNSLGLHHCKSPGGPRLLLEFSDDLRVPNLMYSNFMGVEMVTQLLVQIRGLRHLSISDCYPIKEVTGSRRELGLAINRHKETLTQLKLRESLSLHEAGLDLEQWHSDFVLKIAGCQKLADLSLPLALNHLPSSSYNRQQWIARFPDLVTLTIYCELNDDLAANQNPDLALDLFLASTQLKYIRFRDILAAKDPNHSHRYEQIFKRKDLGQGILEVHLLF